MQPTLMVPSALASDVCSLLVLSRFSRASSWAFWTSLRSLDSERCSAASWAWNSLRSSTFQEREKRNERVKSNYEATRAANSHLSTTHPLSPTVESVNCSFSTRRSLFSAGIRQQQSTKHNYYLKHLEAP